MLYSVITINLPKPGWLSPIWFTLNRGAFYLQDHAKSCFRFFWKSETCFMWNKNVVIHFNDFKDGFYRE
jgi:hypothetical protein